MERLKFSSQYAGPDVRREVARRLGRQPIPGEIFRCANADLAAEARQLMFKSGASYEQAVRHLIETDAWLGLGVLPWLDDAESARVLADVAIEVVP